MSMDYDLDKEIGEFRDQLHAHAEESIEDRIAHPRQARVTAYDPSTPHLVKVLLLPEGDFAIGPPGSSNVYGGLGGSNTLRWQQATAGVYTRHRRSAIRSLSPSRSTTAITLSSRLGTTTTTIFRRRAMITKAVRSLRSISSASVSTCAQTGP